MVLTFLAEQLAEHSGVDRSDTGQLVDPAAWPASLVLGRLGAEPVSLDDLALGLLRQLGLESVRRNGLGLGLGRLGLESVGRDGLKPLWSQAVGLVGFRLDGRQGVGWCR